jgi:hypothetical protein
MSIARKQYRQMIASHDSLLRAREGTLPVDSLDLYLDQLISYFPFMPVKTAYYKLINSGDIHLDVEDTLLSNFVYLHQYNYQILEEWVDIERNFVLKQVLPYMDENAPYRPAKPNPAVQGLDYSFDGEVFYELRKEDEFMNLIKSGKVYKSAILQIYQQNLVFLDYYLKRLNRRLEKEERR